MICLRSDSSLKSQVVSELQTPASCAAYREGLPAYDTYIYMTETKRYGEQRPDGSDKITAGWTRFDHKTSRQLFFFQKCNFKMK